MRIKLHLQAKKQANYIDEGNLQSQTKGERQSTIETQIKPCYNCQLKKIE